MTEPLTDADLAEIRYLAEQRPTYVGAYLAKALAEIDRLRARQLTADDVRLVHQHFGFVRHCWCARNSEQHVKAAAILDKLLAADAGGGR